MTQRSVVIIGSGNAALCAGIAALEAGTRVTLLEKANLEQSGGNSRYTAGAMRFAYSTREQLIALLSDRSDARLERTDFGLYPKQKFAADMRQFNGDRPLSDLQQRLIDDSYSTMVWLQGHRLQFDPIYSRQSFEKDGKTVFWGGLTLEARGEGVGLVEAELMEFRRLGGIIQYRADCLELLTRNGQVVGVRFDTPTGSESASCDALVLACGGFEASRELRGRLMGDNWRHAKVRGTPHNTGEGLTMALAIGAELCGRKDGCHAVPMDRDMPEYGNLEIPYIERKNYRKICYFLGVMLNAEGRRFVDEGQNFRNYTYAQFGREILQQSGHFAWQIFDQKVEHLLYDEYRFKHATFVEASTLEGLVSKMGDVDAPQAVQTLLEFNRAINDNVGFDPTSLDGKCTTGLNLNKSNWANKLDRPPFRAYPVTCGITFTYAGLRIDLSAKVLDQSGIPIPGLFACGEIVGGLFFDGYPGGSGLTSGAVFGRLAGRSAALS